MNYLIYNFLSKIICNVPTPPTNIKSDPNNSWLILLIFLTIFLVILVIFLFSMLYLVNKELKTFKKKCCPVIFTNNATKDIILISNDNYTEVSIQFLIYDEHKNLQKQYVLKETNLQNYEQRKIANINDFENCNVEYKIISFSRKVSL